MFDSLADGHAVRPFELHIDESALRDLRGRLQAVRWPDRETVPGWEQGTPLSQMRRLRDYWLADYDWRRCEATLNRLGQFQTRIDGINIRFLHVRSPEESAFPIILTHGFPGSIIEFLKVIGPLTNPTAHGGRSSDAFDVVIPCLPGYGFSAAPAEVGWDTARIARAWIELMRRLGYGRFGGQGGDWGASVTMHMGVVAPPELAAIHLNVVVGNPDPSEVATLPEEDRARIAELTRHQAQGRGYSEQQSTRPQTLGYGLADSPMGQAAWIYEKYREWSDCGEDPAAVFGLDEMIDNIMLYWLPNAATSSARLYWESLSTWQPSTKVAVPVGVTQFPKEIYRPARRWTEEVLANIVSWREAPRGGHFAAFEVPDIFVSEVRRFFALVR